MSKSIKRTDEAVDNARWVLFSIEFIGSVIIYIALKALVSLAAAELFMLIAFALALCASTGSTSALVKEELKKSRLKDSLAQNGENDEKDNESSFKEKDILSEHDNEEKQD